MLTGIMLGVLSVSAMSPNVAAKAHKAAPRFVTTQTNEASTWHQDTALLQQLASAYPMGVFSVRPPSGYTLVQKNTERDTDYVSLYDWFGDDRTDDTKPELSIQVTKLKPDVVTVVTLDDRLTQLLGDMQKDSPWIQASPYQHGMVNGASFVRTYFKDGPGVPTGQPINHGFIYKATSNDGKYLITIIALDVEPYNTATLPLLEASVLTFRQVQQ